MMVAVLVIVLVVVLVSDLGEMVRFARSTCRVDMHDRTCKEGQVGHELAMNVGADAVSLLDRKRGIDGDVHLRKQLMAEPARAHFRDVANTSHMRRSMLNLR